MATTNNKIRFMAGQIIFREGSSSDKAYLVETGKIKLVKKRDGKELILEHVGSNGIFGEMSLIDGGHRSATAIAEEETLCIRIDDREFQKRLKEIDPFLRGIFRILVERLRGTTERLSMAPLPEHLVMEKGEQQEKLEKPESSHNYGTLPLKEYHGDLGKSTGYLLQSIKNVDERIENLGNDLLYFSRLRIAKLILQETSSEKIIGGIGQAIEPFLREYNAHIVIATPMPVIMCDKKMITEVFRNLITNAIHYNESQERNVEVGFLKNVDTPQGKENNVFYVKDNGVGIAPEFRDQVFQVFKRLHDPIHANEFGAGMGLSFVERIVNRHKGRVWFESEPGKGTTFYFTLKIE